VGAVVEKGGSLGDLKFEISEGSKKIKRISDANILDPSHPFDPWFIFWVTSKLLASPEMEVERDSDLS
jgi:hypothetical protein